MRPYPSLVLPPNDMLVLTAIARSEKPSEGLLALVSRMSVGGQRVAEYMLARRAADTSEHAELAAYLVDWGRSFHHST